MSIVNNATGLYATLGYSFNDPNKDVTTLSQDAQDHLNSIPPIIEAWQSKDISSNTVGGYFQNPLSTDIQSIISTSSNIAVLANTVTGFTTMVTTANTLSISSVSFLNHTNRISGVTPFDPSDIVNPYYENASNYGKTVMYLTNQTDGIVDSSPILGSFTSILIGPQVKSSADTLVIDYNTLYGSITLTTSIDPNTGNTITSNTSNLTPTQITNIINDLNNTNTLIGGRQTQDINFFTNTKLMVNNYNTVKQFSNMGETQTYLINNFIGTPKLLSRINS